MPPAIVSLTKAYTNYFTNEQAICAQYADAYIILHENQISGPYQTSLEAYRVAFAQYEIGTFIVKFCGDLAANDSIKTDWSR